MLHRTIFGLMATTCISITAMTTAAYAQPGDNAAGPTPSATTQPRLEDIVVTARRKSENLQRVPVAASVLSGETLNRQQIRRSTDLQFSAPSLVITPDPLGGSSAPVFQLRGQTSPLGSDDTVVEYFADVPVDSRVIAAGIYDLASVQVIRGPQGTLFGKNSTGGAVVFTPKRATADDYNGYFTANFGNYDLRELTAAINIPVIKDVLAIRASGQLARQDGFIKNLSGPDVDNKDYNAARLSVTFTPTSDLRNDFLATYFGGNQRLNAPIVQAIGGPAFYFPNVVAAFAEQQALGPRTIDQSSVPDNDDNHSYLLSNSTSYNFGKVTLKNIIGYSNVHSDIRLSGTSFQFPLVDVAQDRHLHQFSDELQLSGKSLSDNLNWIIGGFYSNQKSQVHQVSRIFSTAITNVDTTYDSYQSRAIYGQASYDLASIGLSGLKLTGGLRHTWDTREGSDLNVVVPIKTTDGEFSWTVGLDYQVTRDVLVYVASRHSYKAGGFNLISPDIPAQLLTYAPEKLTDAEIGIKAGYHLGSIPMRTNLALYQGWYKDIQTQTTAACSTVNGLNSLIINAGKGQPKGLELEAEARPFAALQLNGFYNRTLGRYQTFTVPSISGCTFNGISNNLSGQNFGNISKNTAGLSAVLTLPTPKTFGEAQLTGNLYYRSSRVGNDLLGFNSPMPGYTLLNFRLDVNNIFASPLNLGVYLRNAANKLYVLTRNQTTNTAGYDTNTYGDPRTYGVEATVKF